MLTMLAAVGLHQILPTYGKELWFPLNELFVSRKDILALAKKDDDLFVVKKPTTPLDTKEKEATKKATNTKAAPAAPSLERTVYHHLIRYLHNNQSYSNSHSLCISLFCFIKFGSIKQFLGYGSAS